jgi:tetratricopeptide (TPR) repeat protein
VTSAPVPRILVVFAVVAAFASTVGAQGSGPPTAAAAGKLALSTNSAAAREAFWRGLEKWQSATYSGGQKDFRRAAALDNEFALARAFATGEEPGRSQVMERDRAIADAARQSTEEGLLALFWREKALAHSARAKALLQAAMQLMPNEPSIAVEYVWSMSGEGDNPKMILDSARAFHARFPNYGPLMFPIALFAMNTGDTAGALRAVEEYTHLAPRAPLAFGYYGILLQQLGRFDEAEAQYRKGMALLPEHSDYGTDPASALAELLAMRGRTADARAVALQALARAPDARDSSMYMSEVAGTYFAAGDVRRATQLLEQARAISPIMGNGNGPDRPDAILAEANAVFGDRRSVGSYLARLHSDSPADSAVDNLIYAISHGYAGQLDSAMIYSDKLANSTVPWRGPWSHRVRGIALATAKQCDRAKAEFVQTDTTSAEVLTAWADCEMQRGHRAEALALRDRAIKSQEFTFFRPAIVRARLRLAQMK